MRENKYSKTLAISGKIADVEKQCFFEGRIYINDGFIERIEHCSVDSPSLILPGFVDSHVHIESSMLTPCEFAREAVKHGMIAAVADPHEIANVLGVDGVYYMLDNAEYSNFKFYFSTPSCVPAIGFDPAGAVLDSKDVERLMKDPRIFHLGEMMNYPGVLGNDAEVFDKIAAAKNSSKPIDGHAPGLSGSDLEKYVRSGITTDHEAVSLKEAEEKIALGMKIIIREGSAAKDFEMLYPLVDKYPSDVMFCTDDCHPDDLLRGTIARMVRRGLKKGLNIFNLIRAASVNSVNHYKLDAGLLRVGDKADMIVVDSLDSFNVLQTYINGQLVYSSTEEVDLPKVKAEVKNNFHAEPITESDIEVQEKQGRQVRVIGVTDKSIYTEHLIVDPTIVDGKVVTDADRDILKMVVVNRYQPSKPAVGFVKNFGLKQGAICSSVSHDSHNIVAIGASDKCIVELVNRVIDSLGGVGVHDEETTHIFPLPIAGIMSTADAQTAAAAYEFIQAKAIALGSKLTAPFMTMAFLSLIVIPSLKLSTIGLFDVDRFEKVDLFV